MELPTADRRLTALFLGHMAVGLAGKRVAPDVSLTTWFAAVQLADLVWPVLLLAGIEHVRIAPGITAFTPRRQAGHARRDNRGFADKLTIHWRLTIDCRL